MTPDRTDETPDDGAEHGVLDASGSLDTSSITILGGHIAQVSVDLPVSDDDDIDDDVVEDELPIIDAESRAFEVVGIVHLPDAVPPSLTHIPDPEVLDHDPGVALWAGADGLDIIRLVEQAARRLLRPGGLLVVEHSDRQGGSAPALLQQAGGWTEIADHRDLTGRDRFVTARRAPAGTCS